MLRAKSGNRPRDVARQAHQCGAAGRLEPEFRDERNLFAPAAEKRSENSLRLTVAVERRHVEMPDARIPCSLQKRQRFAAADRPISPEQPNPARVVERPTGASQT